MAVPLSLIGLVGLGLVGLSSLTDNLGPVMTEDQINADSNLTALLGLIRQIESNNNYHALSMGGEFSSFIDHPANTGEWNGAVGPTGLPTHAAGAYQIQVGTWNDLGGIKRYGDFSPASQDAAASDLITRRGAMDAVNSGDAISVQSLLAPEWSTIAVMSSDELASNWANFGGAIA